MLSVTASSCTSRFESLDNTKTGRQLCDNIEDSFIHRVSLLVCFKVLHPYEEWCVTNSLESQATANLPAHVPVNLAKLPLALHRLPADRL